MIMLAIMIYGYGCLIAGFFFGWQFRDMRRTP